MFKELTLQTFDSVSPLFQPMVHHLAVQSILLGDTPARVFVDDDTRPSSVLAWSGHRYLLAGAPDNSDFNTHVARFFTKEVIPYELAHGIHWMSLYYTPDQWAVTIENHLLKGHNHIRSPRQYYACDATQQRSIDWHNQLPADFELRAIDAALIERTDLLHLDILREEMCSERPTTQDFLARSFGVCLIHKDELAGWCLSEYNCAERCEIGIETRPPFQQRGLGTLMTYAVVNIARTRGITEVGWHCRAANVPSAATALKAGFRHVCDYPAHIVGIKD
jgi:RimJ/RimL family protein N-acetyltransferase